MLLFITSLLLSSFSCDYDAPSFTSCVCNYISKLSFIEINLSSDNSLYFRALSKVWRLLVFNKVYCLVLAVGVFYPLKDLSDCWNDRFLP